MCQKGSWSIIGTVEGGKNVVNKEFMCEILKLIKHKNSKYNDLKMY